VTLIELQAHRDAFIQFILTSTEITEMLEMVTSMSRDVDSYGVVTIVDVMMTIVGVIMMI